MAKYRQAIEWIIENDDTDWVTGNEPLSVTASLVADLFMKNSNDVRRDLIKGLLKTRRITTPIYNELMAELKQREEEANNG
jgi:hypothetical protein